MLLEQSFTVEAPIDTVWEALIDVERIAPCLPGAEITDAGDDGTYKGTFKVKLGPTTANYNGSLRMESVDADAHVATMSAKGTDKRGQGGATATIVSTLASEGGATRVDVKTDFAITGKLARFGRSGMIQDISNRLLKDFATCLQSTIVAEPAPPAQVQTADPLPEAGIPAEPPPSGLAAEAAAAAPTVTPPPAAARPPVQPAKPVGGLSLFFGVLLDRLKRLFSRR